VREAAREEDRTTSFVVEPLQTQIAPDARTPLHRFTVYAHRAAARDVQFYWTADTADRRVGEPVSAKSMMPGDRSQVHLPEPPDVVVAHLQAEWTDDAGERHHDTIHDLRLHAGVEP
jgi:hypothetical protein